MTHTQATGLGEPEPVGKKTLFLPPKTSPSYQDRLGRIGDNVGGRIRMTLRITKKSLAVIQEYQGRYRLENGQALPKWKIISDAIELYDKVQKGEGNEKPPTDTHQ